MREQPFEIPPHWLWATLGDVAVIVGGSTPRSRENRFWDGDIPWLGVSDLTGYGEKYISEGARMITDAGYASCATQLVPAGTVLFSSRAPIGYVAIAERPLCTSQGFKSFVLVPSTSSDYVYWWLRYAGPMAQQRAGGTTFRELSAAAAARLPIPIAPAEEQLETVAVIEAALKRITSGSAAFRAAADACAQLRAAYLSELWKAGGERATVKDVGEVFVGATPSRRRADYWGGGIPWVSSGEVAFCRIPATRESVTESGLGNPERRLHPPGTVLVAMIGEGKTRGQAAILDVAAAHNQNSAAIRPDATRMLPEFLYYALMSRYEVNRRSGGGSQQPALNKSKVEQIEVPLPTLDTQRRLVARVEQGLALASDVETSLRDRTAQAESLVRSLLHAAFTGRLTKPTRGVSDDEIQERLSQIAEQRGELEKARRSRRGMTFNEATSAI